MNDATSKLSDVLATHEANILDEWVKAQLAAPTLRADLMNERELREQSTRFVRLLRAATSAGAAADVRAPAWAPAREFLDQISSSRAAQGFSPSETATFVFSLKEPLFACLQRAHGQAAGELVAAIWHATLVLDRLGLYAVEAYQKTRDEVIRRQQDELLELSTPVIELWHGVLALPLIGTLDSERTQRVMEALLERIVETGSEAAIIDITGVPTVDTLTAQHLLKTAAATRLLGAECYISGIRPQIAQTIVQLGIDLAGVQTKATLAGALAAALARSGRTVTPSGPAP